MAILVTLWIAHGVYITACSFSYRFWDFDRSLQDIGTLALNGETDVLLPHFDACFTKNPENGISARELCIRIHQEYLKTEHENQLPPRPEFTGSISTHPCWFPIGRNAERLLILVALVGVVLFLLALFAKRWVFIVTIFVWMITSDVWFFYCSAIFELGHFKPCQHILASIHETLKEDKSSELVSILSEFPRSPTNLPTEFYMSVEGRNLLYELETKIQVIAYSETDAEEKK
ncbi:MAG: hypothetical protein Q4C70_08785 [Planctomycetia bacterium]|nr:hypothetical protein [Planctomycetia bacterium]